MNILNWLDAKIAQAKQKPNFFYPLSDRKWSRQTWNETKTFSAKTCFALIANKIRRGDFVAIAIEQRAEWEWLELACYKLGAVVVGIDHFTPAHSFKLMLETAQPKILFVENTANLDTATLQFLSSIKCKIISMQSQPDQNSWENFYASGVFSLDYFIENIDENWPATLIFSSGSGGIPKAMLYTHKQMVYALEELLANIDRPKAQKFRIISWLSRANIFQRVVNLCSLASGADLYMLRNPRHIFKALRTVKPQVLIGVPRFFEKVFSEVFRLIDFLPKLIRPFDRRNIQSDQKSNFLQKQLAHLLGRGLRYFFGSQIEYLISGSAALSKDIVQFFWSMKIPLLEAYGMSENLLPISINTLAEHKSGSVGKPLKGNHLYIDDQGELLVKGHCLFTEYFRSTDNSVEFSSQGFYRTGDLAEFDKDGFLFLNGRKKSLQKTSTGKKVYAKPIELKISSSCAVENVIVVAESRPYVVALLFVGPHLLKTAKSYKKILNDINNNLDRHEQIQKALVLSCSLSIEKQELTHNLKTRDLDIAKNYAFFIERCYAENPKIRSTDGYLIHLSQAR